MGISGEVAVPNGTCPAQAVGVATKAEGVSRAMTRVMVVSMTEKVLCFMEVLLLVASATYVGVQYYTTRLYVGQKEQDGTMNQAKEGTRVRRAVSRRFIAAG